MIERAGGNPLFLEEIIRGLAEQGVLRRQGDRWVATGDVNRWSIPGTLRGVLAARIDALPAEAKRALQRAAVVGRFFTHRALQALSEGDGDLERALAQLLRADLIRESGRDPERRYMFKHALVQDAATRASWRSGARSCTPPSPATSSRRWASWATSTPRSWPITGVRPRSGSGRCTTRCEPRPAPARSTPGLRPSPCTGRRWICWPVSPPPTSDGRPMSTWCSSCSIFPDGPVRASSAQQGLRHLTEAGRIAGEAGDDDRLARVEGSQGYADRDEGYAPPCNRARAARQTPWSRGLRTVPVPDLSRPEWPLRRGAWDTPGI